MARRNKRATDIQVWAKRNKRLRQWGTDPIPLFGAVSLTDRTVGSDLSTRPAREGSDLSSDYSITEGQS